VCVSVCQHDNSGNIIDIIMKYSGHHPMVKREAKFENGYIRVCLFIDLSSLIFFVIVAPPSKWQ